MPEGETLPKTRKSKDWLAYADKKLDEFKKYHSERNLLGQVKRPVPLGDDYSKLLSQKELDARKMGMQLLRDEAKQEFRKGGRVGRTGPAKVHKGEAVVRKKPRSAKRSSARR